MRLWPLAGVVCGILWAGLSGCDSGGEKFTPVAGKVTVGGAPLTSGAVTFQPDADKGNNTKHIPVGNLDAQGNYTVTSAATPGAPPGWY